MFVDAVVDDTGYEGWVHDYGVTESLHELAEIDEAETDVLS